MLMSPNKGETAVHGCHCLVDMAVRMRELLARSWLSVCVPLALSLSLPRGVRIERQEFMPVFPLAKFSPERVEGHLTGGFLPFGLH